jgi:hypothetical protein
LVVTETGVTSNDELERAFVREALADPRARPGLSVLWDARRSVTPMTAEDVEWRSSILSELAQQGDLARFALLLGPDQGLTAVAARQRRTEIVSLQFAVFDNESEAAAWLVRGDLE